MKSNYIQHLLNDYMQGWGVAYPTMAGITIDTVYTEKIQKFISEQPEGQFTTVHEHCSIVVRLCKEIITVCHECGSPEFWTRVIEDFESIHWDSDGRVHVNKLVERKVQNRCRHCGELHIARVYKYPEIAP